jgi:pectate lyase
VTNLRDYDPKAEDPIEGSLRWAADQAGPRIVVFRIGGIIDLAADLRIREPYLTIAGQTAPGHGICLRRRNVFVEETHDVVVRYLRSRPGDIPREKKDGLSVMSSQNVILDHCSVSWATDEGMSVTEGGTTNVTIQWCVIAEGLNYEDHSYGSLIRCNGDVTYHHNLYTQNRSRTPRPGTYGEKGDLLLDFRNNAIYNWMHSAAYTSSDPCRVNFVGNYYLPGPDSEFRDYVFMIGSDTTQMYAEGNFLVGVPASRSMDWDIIRRRKREGEDPRGTVYYRAQPFEVAPVETESATEANRRVLVEAGAILPVRDAVDERIVRDVREGTGRIINSQDEVGGWPEYRTGKAPADTDQDGMPDRWEDQHGLDAGDPSDGPKDADGDGYTNVEEFLNSTDPGEADR